jgi:TolA-binding protein
VIEKCELLITRHPDSKYVDDAVLLMGKCFYETQEYDLAITKFEELKANFPQSNLNEEGHLYLARCYIAKESPAQAVPILESLYQAKPDSKHADQVLFYLGTGSIYIGDEDNAVKYLEILADKYPGSPLRLNADIEMADLYTDRGDYEKALAIYDKLAGVNLNAENSIRYLSKLSVVYVRMGDYNEALKVIRRLRGFLLDDETMAAQMLLEGESYKGIDALPKAIDAYESVAARYPRSKYSAEAYYCLGEIYQTDLDSLDVAKEKFDQVPRQYANSPFAEDAVRRSVSITKLKRLQASLGTSGEQDQASVKFELAETELFQFNNTEKALAGYESVLAEFPNSDVAPKAAYAIAYIYEKVLDDKPKAKLAYRRLLRDYPSSQQAEFARKYFEDNKPEALEETRSDS